MTLLRCAASIRRAQRLMCRVNARAGGGGLSPHVSANATSIAPFLVLTIGEISSQKIRQISKSIILKKRLFRVVFKENYENPVFGNMIHFVLVCFDDHVFFSKTQCLKIALYFGLI